MDKRLKEGHEAFLKEYFSEHQDLFENLAKGQSPHTMVITCSDSRVNPALILNAKPGELFIARNIGNVVPPYQPNLGSTQAAVEYAVNALNIPKIVVMGHSDCGACAHMYHEHKEGEPHLVHVDDWLKYIEPAKNAAMLEIHANPEKNIFESTEKHNIVSSVRRLMTYPYIQERLLDGSIELIGMWYDIANGKVEVYNLAENKFECISNK